MGGIPDIQKFLELGNEIYKRDINSPTPAPEELLNKAEVFLIHLKKQR